MFGIDVALMFWTKFNNYCLKSLDKLHKIN